MKGLLLTAHRRLRPGLVLALVFACGVGLASAAEHAAPASPEAQTGLWLPSQSHPGGAQYDRRLDTRVEFWQAGLSLKEVFAGVNEQAGVEIGFRPSGDENERVRVTLYLDPDRPPSLRELMAQLMWVLDCTFAYEGLGGDVGPPTYYLLSTSMSGGAERRLEESREAAMAALAQEWESRAPGRDEVARRLAEYEQALALDSAEVLARYRGRDDHLVVAMLDPVRRASVEFIVGLDDESREALLDGESLTFSWTELTAEQQAGLTQCLSRPPRPWGRRGRRPGAGEAGPVEEGWGDRELTEVRVLGLSYGRPMLSGELEPSDDEPGGRWDWSRFLVSPWLDLTGEGELAPDEAVALRRALGETVPEDEERTLFRDWFDARREKWREQGERRTREAAEAKIAEQRPLSAEVEKTLSSFVLPLDDDTPYALWQIQEAAAAASGLHVVSDCFAQPSQTLSRPLGLLHPGEGMAMTGLLALRLSCLATGDVSRLAWGGGDDFAAGWEWHDAGSFLRFRSTARDLWRASMLPPTASRYLDELLDPTIEEAASVETTRGTVTLALDLAAMGWLAQNLTDLQLRRGGELICGDPSDKATAYRQTLRASTLSAVARSSTMLRVLATFSESQWSQLEGTGLRLPEDLTPDQAVLLGLSGQPEEGAAVGRARASGARGMRGRQPGRRGRGRPGPGGFRAGYMRNRLGTVMRLTEERPSGSGRGRGRGWQRWGRGSEVTESRYLGFWSEDDVREVRPIPETLSVEVAVPKPIGPPRRVAQD